MKNIPTKRCFEYVIVLRPAYKAQVVKSVSFMIHALACIKREILSFHPNNRLVIKKREFAYPKGKDIR